MVLTSLVRTKFGLPSQLVGAMNTAVAKAQSAAESRAMAVSEAPFDGRLSTVIRMVFVVKADRVYTCDVPPSVIVTDWGWRRLLTVNVAVAENVLVADRQAPGVTVRLAEQGGTVFTTIEAVVKQLGPVVQVAT